MMLRKNRTGSFTNSTSSAFSSAARFFFRPRIRSSWQFLLCVGQNSIKRLPFVFFAPFVVNLTHLCVSASLRD